MAANSPEPLPRAERPPAQTNLDRATQLGFEALARQADEQIRWLGGESWQAGWRLPVLNEVVEVDLAGRRVRTRAGREAGPLLRILALHYLGITLRPERLVPEITFADLPNGRTYASVYRQRVLARLCATVGRNLAQLAAAAEALAGVRVAGGDTAFDFAVFPRLSLRLIAHAADEEFPPSATLLLPANIESYFCIEDVVVLSERLVAALCGRPF